MSWSKPSAPGSARAWPRSAGGRGYGAGKAIPARASPAAWRTRPAAPPRRRHPHRRQQLPVAEPCRPGPRAHARQRAHRTAAAAQAARPATQTTEERRLNWARHQPPQQGKITSVLTAARAASLAPAPKAQSTSSTSTDSATACHGRTRRKGLARATAIHGREHPAAPSRTATRTPDGPRTELSSARSCSRIAPRSGQIGAAHSRPKTITIDRSGTGAA